MRLKPWDKSRGKGVSAGAYWERHDSLTHLVVRIPLELEDLCPFIDARLKEAGYEIPDPAVPSLVEAITGHEPVPDSWAMIFNEALDHAGAPKGGMVVERIRALGEDAREARRVCDKPGCLSVVIRRDDGSRVCAAGHESRWVERDTLHEARRSSPNDLRLVGWSVAVHNDYHQDGVLHTFWLLTSGDRAVKGEGLTDAEALDQIRSLLRFPKSDPLSVACPVCNVEAGRSCLEGVVLADGRTATNRDVPPHEGRVRAAKIADPTGPFDGDYGRFASHWTGCPPALSVPCPICGSLIGQPCIGANQSPRRPHLGRIDLADSRVNKDASRVGWGG